MVAYENIIAIKEAISKFGVTPSIEALVGNSFGGTVSLEAADGMESAWYKKSNRMDQEHLGCCYDLVR